MSALLTIAKSAARRASNNVARRHISTHTYSASSTSSVHPRNCGCPLHASLSALPAASAAAAAAVSSPTPFSLLSVLSRLDASNAPAVLDMPSLLPRLSEIVPSLPTGVQLPLECAVPKKRTSISRQRHRRAGDRLQKRRRMYQNYRMCFVCGLPVLQHHICTRCNHLPTRTL